MTQFALCVVSDSAADDELRSLCESDELQVQAARELFGTTDGVKIPFTRHGADIARLATDAYNATHNSRSFETTDLYRVLRILLERCDDIVLWWSNDWSDLPVWANQETFLEDVGRQLAEPVGDVYCRWQRHPTKRSSP